MGKLAGSDGMFGGSSIIDPDGMPFRAKQTNMLNIVTPRSQGGPTENDHSPQGSDSKESSRIDEEFRKKMEAEQASFEKLEKDLAKRDVALSAKQPALFSGVIAQRQSQIEKATEDALLAEAV